MWVLISLLAFSGPIPAPSYACYVVQGTPLFLRAQALKEATLFKVDVYTVSLFMEYPEVPPQEVVPSVQIKAFYLLFHRDIEKKKLADSWMNDLKQHCTGDCPNLLRQGAEIAAQLPDLRKGDTVTYLVLPEGVEIRVNDRTIGRLDSVAAGPSVTQAFLGPKSKIRKRLLREP